MTKTKSKAELIEKHLATLPFVSFKKPDNPVIGEHFFAPTGIHYCGF
jgi:hypothetical protein